MKIECFMSENCGSYHYVRENLDKAISELRVKAELSYRIVHYEEALQLGLKGSPTIRINGSDIDEGGAPGLV